MDTAAQQLDFLRYKGRIFVEVAGLKLWLWKQYDRAVREADLADADVLRAIVLRIEEDTP